MLQQKTLSIEPLAIEGFTDAENRRIEEVLEGILAGWLGTPYSPGKQVKQRGVDCVHFLTAVYDELLGVDHNYESLPADASFHSKDTVGRGIRRFMEMYPSIAIEGEIVQPGDMIICGPIGRNGGPGHGMIAGREVLWHVGGARVCKAGLAVFQGGSGSFREIRRLKDRTQLRRLVAL